MIKIDEDLLMKDLVLMAKKLFMCPNSAMLQYDYLRFLDLNEYYCMNFYRYLDTNGLVIDDAKLEQLLAKDDINSLKQFLQILNANGKILSKSFSNYSKMLDNMHYYSLDYFDKMRRYSEKDFIDLILSYYSTYGNRIYSIVKKYFDERRIQMGHPSSETYSAFFIDLLSLETGYIFSVFDYYSSLSASALVHELGHAVDAEMFLFPQREHVSLFSDYLCEVPSAAFELGFNDYLKEQKIDVDGSMILKNRIAYEVGNEAKELDSFFKCSECNLYMDGMAKDQDGNEHDVRNNLLYGIGYYVAMHLNIIRNSSTEEYLKILNNIITSRNKTDLENIIDMMGITKSDFISGKLIQPVIRKDFNDVKRRFKHKG